MSAKQQALWCPSMPPGPPPPPFVTSTENLTVYRITPQNYTGVENMNTGDAAGDAFVAILVSSLVIVVFVLIGLMLAWFDGTHARYEKVGIEL